MAIDYGTDIKALDDLPDPEELVSGELNVAYAQGRRLLTASDAFEEIGEEDYPSLDLRDYLGARMSLQDQRDLKASAAQVLSVDERVNSTTLSMSIGANNLTLSSTSDGDNGPFDFVMSIGSVNTLALKGG